ncbi:MAG: hypothetical protein ABIN89_13580 [Chitinophagaceae bacterium]
MKQSVSIFMIAIIFISCGTRHAETVENFIPGLYVKQIKQEFAIGMDTIFINLFDKQTSSYKIIRKSSYQQMIDGKMLSPKQEVHNWIAYLDLSKNQLIEPNSERVFTFLPDKNMLLMGSSQFNKVNPAITKNRK